MQTGALEITGAVVTVVVVTGRGVLLAVIVTVVEVTVLGGGKVTASVVIVELSINST